VWGCHNVAQEVVMNLTHFNPFRDSNLSLFKDFDGFFNRFRSEMDDDMSFQSIARSDWIPAVDINETDDEYLLTVEIPQVDKDDIKVEISNGMLNIDGERKYEHEDMKAHRIERFYGKFHRSFRIPENIKEDKIHADHKNGVLYVTLPKIAGKEPARLKIEVH
jgi:HSP20 family protein